MPRKPVYFKGQWYKTMAAAARAHGLAPNTLHKAKLTGTLDKVGNRRSGNPMPVKLNGIEFVSVKDAARYFGVHRSTIERTLEKGLDTYTPKGKSITVGRHEFKSISECARHFNVSRHKVYELRDAGKLDDLLPQKTRVCMNCGDKVNQGTHLCDHCRRQTSGIA